MYLVNAAKGTERIVPGFSKENIMDLVRQREEMKGLRKELKRKRKGLSKDAKIIVCCKRSLMK